METRRRNIILAPLLAWRWVAVAHFLGHRRRLRRPGSSGTAAHASQSSSSSGSGEGLSGCRLCLDWCAGFATGASPGPF